MRPKSSGKETVVLVSRFFFNNKTNIFGFDMYENNCIPVLLVNCLVGCYDHPISMFVKCILVGVPALDENSLGNNLFVDTVTHAKAAILRFFRCL